MGHVLHHNLLLEDILEGKMIKKLQSK